MNDDILAGSDMPNEGSVFIPEEPEEQVKQEEQERGVVKGSAPIFEELIEWFGEKIADTDSIKSVMATCREGDYEMRETVIAYDIVRKILENKKQDLETKFDLYVKR